MKYMGSKRRIMKYIKPIIESYISDVYIEPFVGGANSIEQIDAETKIGLDINEPLINSLIKIRDDVDDIPDLITEEMYDELKKEKNTRKDWLVGYVGFNLSFGGKWFGGYRRRTSGDKSLENMKYQSEQSLRSVKKQSALIKDTIFIHSSYEEYDYVDNSVIYCDIPYRNATKYNKSFDYEKFYQWCFEMSKKNTILVSEYNMPKGFDVIWQKEINNNLNNNKSIEKLYICQYKKLQETT